MSYRLILAVISRAVSVGATTLAARAADSPGGKHITRAEAKAIREALLKPVREWTDADVLDLIAHLVVVVRGLFAAMRSDSDGGRKITLAEARALLQQIEVGLVEETAGGSER